MRYSMDDECINVWFRIPFTAYFVARYCSGLFCLVRKEWVVSEYVWEVA